MKVRTFGSYFCFYSLWYRLTNTHGYHWEFVLEERKRGYIKSVQIATNFRRLIYEDREISFQTFFVWHSSGCNALVVSFQQHLEDPMEDLFCEHVNDLRRSPFHLLNCLITTASELKEEAKVTVSKAWTTVRLRNCLDAHLAQIVCDMDGFLDWCIVLVEMLLTRFEECWPLPRNLLLNSH